MARDLPDLVSPETIGLASLGLVAAGAIYFTIRSRRKHRLTPEQLEAQRRQWLSLHGKLAGGEILEVQDDALSFLYDVRGIGYSTSQDISSLGAYLPANRWSIVGGVGVKYDPRNPANSIVVSETWTGLRERNRDAG